MHAASASAHVDVPSIQAPHIRSRRPQIDHKLAKLWILWRPKASFVSRFPRNCSAQGGSSCLPLLVIGPLHPAHWVIDRNCPSGNTNASRPISS